MPADRLRKRIRQPRPGARASGDFRALAARGRGLPRGGARRRTRPGLRPLAAPDHRSVPGQGRRRDDAARDVHSWRLVALARPGDVQPDGGRAECARRRRSRSPATISARRSRSPPSSSRCARPACGCGASSASASWSTAIPPAGISPPAWWRSDWKALRLRRARRSGAGGLCDLRRVRSRAARARVAERRICGSTRRKRGGCRRCTGRCPPAARSTPWSAALESSEFLRQSKIIADAWRARGVATRYEEIAGTTISPSSMR